MKIGYIMKNIEIFKYTFVLAGFVCTLLLFR